MTPSDAPTRTFRVTVRGRFHELTDAARRYLVGAQAEHDIFKSGFTPEGTFTYDAAIDFFNLRYEVRVTGTDGVDEAKVMAELEAEQFLRTMKIGFKDFRVTAMDMSAMWDKQRR